ncbi:MAG TPA: FAD-dependent monooxygenase, partial [Symbiobacteriaceae bacterium]|nr:FAD-dependent monooxygenase [Symbiobacteriaceae bacterium]
MTAPDVLIVGAGPAGAALGGLLAQAGQRVLLVEQARHPRPKPCGECLNPGALAVVNRLGLPLEGTLPLKGWRVSTGRRTCDLDFPGGLTAAAVDRARFDQALAGWAVAQGVRLEEGVRVSELLRDSGGRVTGARAGRTPLKA